MSDLETVKDWYQSAVDQSRDSHIEAKESQDFYDGRQWSAEELKELKRRGQPAVVTNRIKPKIDALLGLEIQTRTDIKGFPRNPQDEDAAEAATDALRFIADNNDFDKVKTTAAFNVFVKGRAAGITEVVKKKNGYEVVQSVIPFDRYFIDPHAERLDGLDKKFDGVAIWMDESDARRQHPNKEAILTATQEELEVHADKPEEMYYDASRKRVKLVEMFYNDGSWKRCVFTGGGFVVEPHDSPYLDDEGNPSNPIETVTACLDRDNDPYGPVRQLKPIQREINARRSRALHLLNTRQIIMEEGAVEDINQTRKEASKADGVIVRNKGFELELSNTADLAQGQASLLQEAKSEIDQNSINAALTGDETRNLSGRALQARQQGGTLEITPVLDNLRDWQKRMYVQAWNRVKQFWTEERWIRVTDDERNVQFVPLNRPVTAREALMREEGGEAIVAQLGNDPRLDLPVEIENPTSELDLDIILEDVPDTVNIMAEQFELLANVASSNPDAVPFEMLIEMSSIRNKDRILERLKGGTPEEQAATQQRLEKQDRASDAVIAKDEAKATLDFANAQQAQVETQLAMVGREAI